MTTTGGFREKWQTMGSVSLLFIVLWGLSWWLNRSISIYVSDTGIRFIQIRELVANRWQTLAVNYPGRIFDPELIHVPYYYAHSLVGDEIFMDITPFMPWLSSWGYAAWGVAGMMLVPVLGGVLTAVAIYRLAQLSRLPNPHLIMWLTIFASPMFFYSLEPWDHTLATAAAAWSVYWLAKGIYRQEQRWLLLAGMAVGFGLGQRPEMYLFALCVGAGFLLVVGRDWRDWRDGWPWRSLLTVIGGGLITAVPIWIWQYSQVGHPLGMAVATNLLGYGERSVVLLGTPEYSWQMKLSRKLFLIDGRDLQTFVASLSVTVGLFWFVLAVRVKQWQRPGWWLAATTIFLSGSLLFFLKAFTVTVFGLNGVLATFPLIMVSLLFVEPAVDRQALRPVYELVFSITFLFLAGMVLIWPAFGGLQWGWRYALPFFPLAVYLAFYNYHAWLRVWQGLAWCGAAADNDRRGHSRCSVTGGRLLSADSPASGNWGLA
jgi:4-amino-4-deoxy-L-arabinose transferase-like glycosyltransferase